MQAITRRAIPNQGKSNPLNEKEKQQIRIKYQNLPVKDLAVLLKRSNKTIYDFLDSEGLSAFNSRPGFHGRDRREKVKPGCFDEKKFVRLF